MARPIIKGIDYYPLNVDFLNDLKIKRVIKACGPSSVAIIVFLLGNIYKDEGYFMRWNEDICFLIADDIGVKEVYVDETVKKCLQVGLFDCELFEKYKVLTSKGIQKRFFEITKRRKNIHVISELLLINVAETGVNVAETGVNAAETGVIVSKSTQRKGKKRKEKESKERELYIKNNLALFNNILKHKITLQTLSKIKEKYDLDLFLEKIKESTWIRENIDLNKASDDFLLKISRGDYKTYKTKNKNSFHNFQGITASYSSDELEDVARKKREEAYEKYDLR